MDQIDALLDDAGQVLAQIRSLNEGTLVSRETDVLAPKVKSVLEHQRSTLDYVANKLRKRYCPTPRPGERVYYPLAFKTSNVNTALDKNLPTLRQNEPHIARAIREYQPHGRPWLRSLITLVNPAKHEAPVALHLGVHIPSAAETGGGSIILPGSAKEPAPSAESTGDSVYTPFAGGARVDWLLTDVGKPLLPTLSQIQAELPGLLAAVRGAAQV